jgi:prepilin-type N-terminal cleavage/methylation domain-containing protein
MRADRVRRGAPGFRSRSGRGYSLAELLVVVAIAALVILSSAAAWSTFRRRAEIGQTARVMKSFLYRARMLAVYQGVDHFIVIDPQSNRLEIWRDSSAPKGKLDSGDVRVAWEPIPQGSVLALPAAPSPLANPLGVGEITNAWSLPLPESGGAWANRRGLMATTSGTFQSVEATPQTITSGVMVFTDRNGQTSSIAVRGQAGSVRAFEMLSSGWKEL